MSEDQLCMSFPVQEVGAVKWSQEEHNLAQKEGMALHAMGSRSVKLLAGGFEKFAQSLGREIHWSVETASVVGSSWADNNWWLGEYWEEVSEVSPALTHPQPSAYGHCWDRIWGRWILGLISTSVSIFSSCFPSNQLLSPLKNVSLHSFSSLPCFLPALPVPRSSQPRVALRPLLAVKLKTNQLEKHNLSAAIALSSPPLITGKWKGSSISCASSLSARQGVLRTV